MPYHFSKAYLLEVDGEVAGGLIGGLVKEANEPLAGFPDYFAPLLELESFAHGFWAVIGLAVYSEFRGKGYARHLLDFANGLAKSKIAKGLSLVVEDTNSSAVSLYRHYGFETLQKRPWLPFGERTKPKFWLLMTKPL